VILSLITYSQFWPRVWGFTVSKSQKVSTTVAGIACGCLLSLVAVFFVIVSHGGYDPSTWAWLDLVSRQLILSYKKKEIMLTSRNQIYTFSYVKLVVTIVKYIPQAWVNYKRKSTVGWDIKQILFDLAGGILSILQLVIDSSFQNDWSGITGNPVKFGLGNITILFDLILIVQHYCLYPNPQHDKAEDIVDHTTPLLPDHERTQR
jgi:cystinosin